MAKRMKFTDRARTQFLEVFARTCNVTHAARSAGISRSRVYDIRKENAEFAAAWDEAEETAVDSLEGEARRRALEGIDEPIVYQGEIQRDGDGKPVTIKKYSDTLLMFLLKAHRPEKYRERFDIKGDGKGDAPMTVGEAEGCTRAQLIAIATGRPVPVGNGGQRH